MPTYENRNPGRITFPGKNYLSWQPGERKALLFHVPYKMLGLTKVSSEPYVLRNKPWGIGFHAVPMLAGERVVVDLPWSETVELSVYTLAGSALMWIGDSDVPILIDKNNNHASRYPWDMTAYLTFEADEDGEEEMIVYVKCEPFAVKGF